MATNDDDISLPAAPRSGSGLDLARRMDRMESRQDSMETALHAQSAVIARVELNQTHSEELNKLRFSAIDTSIANLTGTVGAFITRIEGIITGEVETAQSKQGRDMVADYLSWRTKVDAHMTADESERKGFTIALSGVRGTTLLLLGVAGPIIMLYGLLTR